MSDTTARLGLPTIRAGQAQKELSHNEALTLIDLSLQADAIDLGMKTPPATPEPGQAWVVGTAPTGAWSGRADHLAGWTEGGWRFVAPRAGMAVWLSQPALIARYSGGAWTVGEVRARYVTIDGARVIGARQPAIASPAGGSVIDLEARTALAAALTALRAHGLIQS